MADAEVSGQATSPSNQPNAGAGSTSASSLKKEKSSKAKNPRSKPTHPPTSEMVTNAIKGLKERGGSSLQAIKKYIAANYKVDAEKVAPFIKKYLKSAVISGTLVQTKGKGASGSFKLAASSSSAQSKQSSSGGATSSAAGDRKKGAGTKAKKDAAKKSAAIAL